METSTLPGYKTETVTNQINLSEQGLKQLSKNIKDAANKELLQLLTEQPSGVDQQVATPNQKQSSGEVAFDTRDIIETVALDGRKISSMVHQHLEIHDHGFELSDADKQSYRQLSKDQIVENQILGFQTKEFGTFYRWYVAQENGTIADKNIEVGWVCGEVIRHSPQWKIHTMTYKQAQQAIILSKQGINPILAITTQDFLNSN
jgi:hypothetical protein